jgi:hypothetical protein
MSQNDMYVVNVIMPYVCSGTFGFGLVSPTYKGVRVVYIVLKLSFITK